MAYHDVELVLDKAGKVDRKQNPISNYQPEGEEKDCLMMIRSNFTQGYTMQQRPRTEFNDLSFIERDSIDQMAWAVYQPNDGDALEGDQVNSWRSQAVRPIVRNKVFSIAAHVTAHTLFPKICAFDSDSNEQQDAAQVMSDLMEWSTTNTNAAFADVSLRAVLAALVRPISIVFTQYVTVFRDVKREKLEGGGYRMERIIDEDQSGFQDESVPPDQIFVADFYQPDIQKQGWVIRRRVRPFTTLRQLYSQYDNFDYVLPGIQCIFNDANQEFYNAYDPEMSQDDGEEVLLWNKTLDLFLIAVNGVLLTEPDNPNPREDKLYPFSTFGYEYLRANGDCFYWKSLAFKTMPDDKIVNTLYPMIIDGTYLAIMPPMVNIGGEIIESDVIVPGGVTTFSSPDADLKPLAVQSENLKAGMDALFKVEENISEDAFQPMQAGDVAQPDTPAYNIAAAEKQQKLLLGPFLDMVGRYVKQMGRLRIGDISQYLTLPEVTTIEGSANADLIYKTFVLPQGNTRQKSRRIEFSMDMPDEKITAKEALAMSYKVLEDQGEKMSLARVNPTLIRTLKYVCFVGTDVLAPMSDELESRWNLMQYDRMIEAPNLFDAQETGLLLMQASPTTKRHPEKYIAKNPSMGPPPMSPAAAGQPTAMATQ